MYLGIDFGTTRTVVAAADRGNYPVVSFHPEDGDTLEWYPSVVAARNGEIVFGFDAAQKQADAGWNVLRSFKRRLGMIGPDDHIEIGDHKLTALELLTGFLSALRSDLLARSNLRVKRNEKLHAMISARPTRTATSGSSRSKRSAKPASRCAR